MESTSRVARISAAGNGIRLQVTIVLFIVFVFMVSSCEYTSEITGVDIGRFPERIVYFANEDTELDFAGMTLIFNYRRGRPTEEFVESHLLMPYEFLTVTHSVDFSKCGVYEVTFSFGKFTAGRIPVQVIDRAELLKD